MSLIRYYSPLDRAFERAIGAVAAHNGAAFAGNGSIDLDVVETADAYIVKAEVPGVAKEQIEVKVEDRDVTISVEYREDVEANGKALLRERTYGKASRAIRLPEAVDANAAQAKQVDGVLQLTLPKVAKVNVKQITIN